MTRMASFTERPDKRCATNPCGLDLILGEEATTRGKDYLGRNREVQVSCDKIVVSVQNLTSLFFSQQEEAGATKGSVAALKQVTVCYFRHV